ncbi:MAG: hypothetical protein GTO02_07515 [Candidatus Dadabacteria bacterium]|nr:hypothetical protein [Candidatus Dadabacteria bacterium]
MISLCTVILESANQFLGIYEEWVVNRTKLVKEVCFCKIDAPSSFYEEKEVNNIKFKTFGYDIPTLKNGVGPGHQHALGLHECIDRSTQPYVLLCDPDIFFYTPTDEVYYNITQELSLDIIGCSHHASTEIAQGYFPWHGNLLVQKSKLPGPDWMKGKFAIEGKYLLMDAVEGYTEMFPNKTKNFDTSAYLWLWAFEQNWKWLAFQTIDCHSYNTAYHRNNFGARPKFKKQKLIYHGVSGSIIPREVVEPFVKNYETSKEDEE